MGAPRRTRTSKPWASVPPIWRRNTSPPTGKHEQKEKYNQCIYSSWHSNQWCPLVINPPSEASQGKRAERRPWVEWRSSHDRGPTDGEKGESKMSCTLMPVIRPAKAFPITKFTRTSQVGETTQESESQRVGSMRWRRNSRVAATSDFRIELSGYWVDGGCGLCP